MERQNSHDVEDRSENGDVGRLHAPGRGDGHHVAHGDARHTGHADAYRRRFWITLILAVPVFVHSADTHVEAARSNRAGRMAA